MKRFLIRSMETTIFESLVDARDEDDAWDQFLNFQIVKTRPQGRHGSLIEMKPVKKGYEFPEKE